MVSILRHLPILSKTSFRLAFLFILLITPLCFFSIWETLQRRDNDIQNELSQLYNITNIAKAKIEEYFIDAKNILITLSKTNDITENNFNKCNSVLQKVSEQYKQYTCFSKINLNGDILCGSTENMNTMNVSNSSHFQKTVTNKTFTISHFAIGPIYNKPIIIFSQPIQNSTGDLKYIISTAINLHWLTSILNSITTPQYYSIVIFDINGIILASSNESQYKIGDNISYTKWYDAYYKTTSPQFSFIDEYNKTILASKAQLDNFTDTISIIAMAPEKLVLQQAQHSFLRQISMMIVTLLFSSLVVRFASNKLILNKIKVLSQQASQLAAGDMKARSPNATGHDELAELARAFNTMAAQFERREIALHDTIKDKELLLKEIHHRVKNNLQVVSGLIRLRQNQLNDKETQSFFFDLGQRVESMAAVHESMYKSGEFGVIRFDDYVCELANNLKTAFYRPTGNVAVTVEAEPIRFGLDQAIPCALFISELVSNALQHAFVDGRDGNISIELSHSGTDMFRISVSDNGIGLPDPLHWRSGQSLGLRLAAMLVEHQLRGSLSLKDEMGTIFVAEFRSDQAYIAVPNDLGNEDTSDNNG